MKKKFFMYVMMLFAVAMGTVVFSSCGDDENSGSPSPIVGTWKCVYEDGYVVIEFKSNGTGKLTEYYRRNGELGISEEEKFTWKYDSETHRITLLDPDEGEEWNEKFELIDDDTIIHDDFVFKRQ